MAFSASFSTVSGVLTRPGQPNSVPPATSKVIVGGTFTTYNGIVQNRITQLNPNGIRDSTFNSGTGFDNQTTKVLRQPDGKIIVSGVFTTYNGIMQNCITRLLPDGSRDVNFLIGSGFNSIVNSLALQSNGKIVAGGNFTTFNGITQNCITQLNPDGTRDATFVVGSGFSSVVEALAIQSDGKILAGGGFAFYQGVTVNRIARLTAAGSRDTTFNTGTGFNGTVQSIVVQPDGKILVGGAFVTYDGTTQNSLVRLNADGSRDLTFDIGAGFSGQVVAMALQPDGKILVGGGFDSYQGIATNRLIRLNADGSRDSTFDIGSGFDSTVYALALQPDGKILVGGFFTVYNGTSINRLIRLNANGSRDSTFNIGTGFNPAVASIAVVPTP